MADAKAKVAAETDDTETQQTKPWLFKPGQSGNLKGRPKGSRNKLAEDFLADMLSVWQEKGKAAVEATAKEHPEKFVSIVAGLLPKQLEIKDELSEMTDEQLAALHGALVVLARNAPSAAGAVIERDQAQARH